MELAIEDKYYQIIVDPIYDIKNQLIGAVHTVSDRTEKKNT